MKEYTLGEVREVRDRIKGLGDLRAEGDKLWAEGSKLRAEGALERMIELEVKVAELTKEK